MRRVEPAGGRAATARSSRANCSAGASVPGLLAKLAGIADRDGLAGTE
jgi:hypothetical protein